MKQSSIFSILSRPIGRTHDEQREPSHTPRRSPYNENFHEDVSIDYPNTGYSSQESVKAGTKYRSYQVDKPLEDDTTRKSHFLFNWWQETASCLLSLASLMALFATLYFYGDKPSPDWPRWLSLNTIVAIYIVLLKSGVLLVAAAGIGQLKWAWFEKTRPLADLATFDEASRGPLGSLALLWMLGIRHFLSSCGALIIVLALAVDPFAQQILHYYECSVPETAAHPSLPRTNYFIQSESRHINALQESIAPGLEKAINAGIFSPGGQPSADCSTGNCTWTSDYSSVGWCSSCDDITNLVSFSNDTWTNHSTENNITREHGKFITHPNSTFAEWNFTTSIPGGLSCSTEGSDFFYTYSAMGPSPPKQNFGTSMDFLLAKNYAGTADPTTGDPWTDCGSAAANETWKCQGYGAARCALTACVKTYTASMHAGRLRETLVSTSSQWGNGLDSGFMLTMLDTKCIDPNERNSLEELGYKLTPSERFIAYNMTFPHSKWPLDTTFPESLLARDCIYAIDYNFAYSLASYFTAILSGQVVGPLASNFTQNLELPLGQFTGPQAVQSFFNFGNVTLDYVDHAFANLSESVTNYMRQNGAWNFSEPALGVAKQDKACIAVRWPWLAFPTSLVALTIVFFVVMVLETRPTGTRPDIWKSSALALLYHGLAGEKALPTKDVDYVRGMQVLAESTTAQLNNKYSGPARLEVQAVTL